MAVEALKPGARVGAHELHSSPASSSRGAAANVAGLKRRHEQQWGPARGGRSADPRPAPQP